MRSGQGLAVGLSVGGVGQAREEVTFAPNTTLSHAPLAGFVPPLRRLQSAKSEAACLAEGT